MPRSRLIIVGAGPVGLFLAGLMAQAGVDTRVYERRPDPRCDSRPTTRPSVNLALSLRGLRQLDHLGLARSVLSRSAAAYGRLVHSFGGGSHFEPYSRHGHALHFVLRSDLERLLIERIERLPGLKLHFGARCADVDADAVSVRLEHSPGDRTEAVFADAIVAADGGYSTVRRVLMSRGRFDYQQRYLDHGYKELTIEPRGTGRHELESGVLHVWRREGRMLLGFPNHDGTLTLSLYQGFEGSGSFGEVRDEEALRALFAREFPEVGPLSSRVIADYVRQRPNAMMTVRCAPWTLADRVALIGDAAHAVVPHLGQGVTAGFEDCVCLAGCVQRCGPEEDAWSAALAEYAAARLPDADAIAELALAHVGVLRGDADSGDPLDVRIGAALDEELGLGVPTVYELVAFTMVPFSQVLEHQRTRESLVRRLRTRLASAPGDDEIRAAVRAVASELAASEREPASPAVT